MLKLSRKKKQIVGSTITDKPICQSKYIFKKENLYHSVEKNIFNFHEGHLKTNMYSNSN